MPLSDSPRLFRSFFLVGTRKYLVNVDVLRRSQLNLKLSFMTMLTIFAPHLPHVFMPAHVNLLKLFGIRGAQVLPHFNGNMFRQHWQQKTFLRKIIRPDDWDGQIWNAEVNKIKKIEMLLFKFGLFRKMSFKIESNPKRSHPECHACMKVHKYKG